MFARCPVFVALLLVLLFPLCPSSAVAGPISTARQPGCCNREMPVPRGDKSEPRQVGEDEPEDEKANEEEPVCEAEEVVITATRSRKLRLDVPEKVNVIDREEIDRRGESGITNVMRYEAGIRVENGPMPFMENLSVRGFSQGRVLLTIDGIRTTTVGGTHGGGFNVDISGISRVEVVRGPASTVYGSRAIGGVVNIITREPRQRLTRDCNIGLELAESFRNVPLSFRETAALYGVWEKAGIQWQIGGTRDDAGKYTDSAGNITCAGWDATGAGAKLIWTRPEHRIALVGNHFQSNIVLNDGDQGLSTPSPGKIYLKDRTRKDAHNYGLHLAYGYEGEGPVSNIHATAYLSGGRALDLNDDDFVRSGKPFMYSLDSDSEEDGFLSGIETRVVLALLPRSTPLDLTLGALVERETYSNRTLKRETLYPNPHSTESEETTTVESALFPDTLFLSLAGYALAELALCKCLLISGGLRYDHFFINPDEDTTGYSVEGFDSSLDTNSEWNLSPKLAVVYKPIRNLSVSARATRGFHMSGPKSRYYNFYHPGGGGFYVQGNPELGPEYSWNYEIGVKARCGRLWASLAGFLTDADDFIDIRLGENDEGFAVRRYENVSHVLLYGAELELQVKRIFSGLDLVGNITVMDGKELGAELTDESGNVTGAGDVQYPVVPWYGSLQVRWNQRHGGFGWYLSGGLRFQGRQSGYVTDSSLNVQVEPPGGFFLVDLSGGIDWKRRYKLNVGVSNLLDTTYQEPLNRLSYSAPRIIFANLRGRF